MQGGAACKTACTEFNYANGVFGVERRVSLEEAKEFLEESEEEGPDSAVRRKECRDPYGMDSEDRFYRYNAEKEIDEMVNDGGYRDGVLVDRGPEEEEFGAFTGKQLAAARRLADRLCIEPRILGAPQHFGKSGEIREDGPMDKEQEKKRVLRALGQVTQAEIDEHNDNHTPCRS